MTAVAESLGVHSVSEAEDMLRGVVRRTPLTYEGPVGHGNRLYAKQDGEQIGGTFKTRGMYIGARALMAIGIEEVIIVSAGNAAAGGAYAVNQLGMHATILMPYGTPQVKIDNTRELGRENVTIQLHGNNYAEADEKGKTIENASKPRLHAFDNRAVILGQATMSAEVLAELPDVDRLFVPVGGGSALAGALTALDESDSEARVVAVQFEGNTSMEQSVKASRLVPSNRLNTLCEGSAVKKPGVHTFETIMEYRDRVDFITITAAEIGEEVMRQDQRRQELALDLGALAFENFPELTGLLALAGAQTFGNKHPEINGEKWAAMITGSNADPAKEAEAVAAWRRRKMLQRT
jgi:threonine dehydratase